MPKRNWKLKQKISRENWDKSKVTFGWELNKTMMYKDSTKKYYICKFKKSQLCSAQLLIDLSIDKNIYNIYECYEHNDHEKPKIRLDLKPLVKKYFDQGIKTPSIIYNLLVKEIEGLTIKNIYNTIYYLKQGNHKKNPSTKDINNYVNNGDNEDYIIRKDVQSGASFKVLITKSELVDAMRFTKNIHIDSTYRLVQGGYPVIVIGITNTEKSFKLLAISICAKEDTESYHWCFEEIKSICNERSINLDLKVLIADGATQITNATEISFPQAERVLCWAHVCRNIKDLVKKVDKTFEDHIMEDIYFLQLQSSNILFNLAIRLFYVKWSEFDHLKDFLDKFLQNHILFNSTWYEGVNVHFPSTNNALERFNLTIKDKYAGWEQKCLFNFIDISKKMLDDQTKSLDTNSMININYNDVHTTFKYHFIFVEETENYNSYLVTKLPPFSTEEPLLIRKAKEAYLWHSISEMKEFYYKYPIIKAKSEILTYFDFYCTCYSFLKDKKCQHVYVFLKDKNKLNIVELDLLYPKKKRGRKPNIEKRAALKRK